MTRMQQRDPKTVSNEASDAAIDALVRSVERSGGRVIAVCRGRVERRRVAAGPIAAAPTDPRAPTFRAAGSAAAPAARGPCTGADR